MFTASRAGSRHYAGAGSGRWTGHQDVTELARSWRMVCEATPGAFQSIDTVTGPTIKTPRIGSLAYGPPVTFTAELLPGQLPDDLRKVAHRLAPHLGARMLRIAERGLGYVRVSLLTGDPLESVVPPAAPVVSALDPLTLGIGEDGAPITLDLATAAHVIVQGSTGSGKSVGMYSLLAQLADATDVRVTGVDPTGLLLAPWAGRWSDVPAPALGTTSPLGYLLTLDQVVREMDRRIAALPAGRDSVQLGCTEYTPDDLAYIQYTQAPQFATSCDLVPVLLVVLEEYPAQLRILDNHDAKVGKQYRALVGRLLAEGRKAGVRVVLVTQRADAAIVGAYERGQASHRISFRVDTREAVSMLHPDAQPDQVAQHATAPAGVALLTAPGMPLTRLRAPYLEYPDYCDGLAAVPAPVPDGPRSLVLAGRVPLDGDAA